MVKNENIIETGKLGDNSDTEYIIHILDEEDVDAVMALHGIMIKALKNPLFFKMSPKEFFEKCLSGNRLSLGITVEEKLVACRITFIPDSMVGNQGMEVGIPAEELTQLAQFEGIITHPEYRRLGLGKKIMETNIAMIDKTDIRHIVATCYPENYPVIKILLGNGFVIKNLKETYGNMIRFFVHRNRDMVNTREYRGKTIVDHLDYEKQKKLLDAGLVGVGIEKTDNGYSIVYANC
ncbi:MAG: GNAT family N-acetyltransferase [Waddliaceae bacterium]|jgi:ribosomal protein S18 acetylase RimI-like enzyme|nr:GNAT family N-acetyltransferase [Waddliaceae bacterium]MBT3578829.1 GNAT family N-acetyltransferase [Waddliaceae bacterium]MBT4445205.1 GNAT family N-acetyltransferase [Waddliaceae bacterium]MBT6928661.1 GNAT family N-acetyltransferase [Waddliaceae bacterium]MBT7264723.1 GNAT family N-acetyltransferase [Waddliaceae bacterium]